MPQRPWLLTLVPLLLAACGGAVAPASNSAVPPTPPEGFTLKLALSQSVGQDSIESVSFSPNGRRLAVGAGDGVVAIFSLSPAPGEEPVMQKLHAGFVSGLAWSPDGRQILTAATDGKAQQSDSLTLQPIRSFPTSPNSHPAVAWSNDGRQIAVATGKDILQTYDGATGAPLGGLPVPGETRAVVPEPEGQWAVGDGTGRIVAGATQGKARQFDPATPHKAVNSLSQAGGLLAVGYDDGAVELLDPVTMKLTSELPRGRQIGNVAWSPNGKLLAVSSVEFAVDVWDPSGASPKRLSHKAIGYDVNGLAWSPDGALLAAGVDDHTFKIWQVSPAQGPASQATSAPSAYMGR